MALTIKNYFPKKTLGIYSRDSTFSVRLDMNLPSEQVRRKLKTAMREKLRHHFSSIVDIVVVVIIIIIIIIISQ